MVTKMKKLILLACATCFAITTFSQTNSVQNKSGNPRKTVYSYTPDGKTYYDISTKKILVKFKPDISFTQQAEIVNRFPQLMKLERDMLLPAPKVSLLELNTENLGEEKVQVLIAALNRLEQVVYANPFLVYKDGTLQGIQEKLFVKLRSLSDLQKLEQEAKKHKLILGKQYEYDPLMYFLEVTKNSDGNALEIANKLAETNLFSCAEPDFLLLLKKMTTNDAFINYQWSLNNTGSSIQYNGTSGADMKIFNAWTISTGNSSTKIAVIDEGVDLVHPDLIGNMLAGFDGTGQGSGGAPSGNDAHGTACAGIIAALANNSIGVAGVAYNAKIVPVRIAYGSGSSWVTSNAWIGTSIDWAWNQGDADVLSNSWGGGSSSTLINDPIGRAVTQGRGNLGSPVLFAAGNNNSAVSYPATLSNVISVTAMSMCNQRKSPSSCDGESFWGSNYGVNGDVSAPGVKIYTTDISGASGYSSGDYTATFNGTSSATPNTAGVMALILATNPGLSMTQARQILESSCDKVGGYTYTAGVANQPNGTWSNDLGYGRVNAFTALQLANPQPCVNPPVVAITNASPGSICSPTTISFSLSGILFGTGQTYQWQSSSDNITYTNIAGATSTGYSASVSASTWFRAIVTCGSSTNSTPVQVIYNSPTISSFPYTQNFDGSSSLPCGWSTVDVNADGFKWLQGSNTPRSAPNSVTYYWNTNATTAANDWLFTAPLSMTAGVNYRVRVWYRAESASYAEKMEIKWGSAATAAGMTSTAVFSNSSIANTTFTEGVSSLISPTSSGTYYVGFRAFSDADKYNLTIDDITIEVVSGVCSTPLLGGTITGPTSIATGSSSPYSITGNTGTNIQWEQSINGGSSWTSIAGATTASVNLTFPPGTVMLRARSSAPATACPDVYSNVLTVTVSAIIGDLFSNPIIANMPFTGSYSSTAGSGYYSDYTGANQQASPDIFFRFTTGPCADSIKISSCGSNFDSYIHLLNATGTNIVSNDDYGPYCPSSTAGSLKADVAPNTTYYAVFEGYSTNTGTISVNIEQISLALPTLTVTASGPTTFCEGNSVTLTVSPSSGIVWNTSATTPSIMVNTSGNYFATIPGPAGCTSTSNTIAVVVNPLPVVIASNVSGCNGSAISLSGSPAGGSFSIANPYIGPSTTYSYTYTNGNGCSATSSTASVVAIPLPVVTATNVSGCDGTPIILIGSPAGGSFSIANPYSGPSITYSYTYTNGNGCSAISSPATVTVSPCNSFLNLTLFLEGYYTGAGLMTPVMLNEGFSGTPAPASNDVDDITVELHSVSIPATVIASTTTRLKTNGNATCSFPPLSGNYYVVVKHRNTIQTWSASPVAIGASPATYDFSNTVSKAYGDNQKQVDPGVWAMYSGEILQDDNLDLVDLLYVQNDITNFQSGYVATDVNGDGNVDLLDIPTLENNVTSFIFSIFP